MMNILQQTRSDHRILPASRQNQRLPVSKNARYLEYEDGVPFFYLGDTAWELLP